MTLVIDILSQIPRLLKELISIGEEASDRRRELRATFFKAEILPFHESMKAIHADYTSSFTELAALLESGSTVPRVIELLKKRRLVEVTSRSDLKAYAEAVRDLEKRGYLRNRQVAALHRYAEGIREYFVAASPMDARVSWYTWFIEEFEDLVRRGISPYETSEFSLFESSAYPTRLATKAFEDALHTDRPNAWARYSETFRALQMELAR